LVVIAIIALLAAMLLPVITRSREKVRTVVCMSNMKQVSLTRRYSLYDNQGRLPMGEGLNSDDWNFLISEEGQPNRGWVCPSTELRPVGERRLLAYAGPNPSLYAGAADQPWSWFEYFDPPQAPARPPRWHVGSYTFNGWLWGPFGWDAANAPRAFNGEGDVQRPVLTPIYAEGMTIGAAPVATDGPANDLYLGWNHDSSCQMAMLTLARHRYRRLRAPTPCPFYKVHPGAINVSFMDGHVGTVALEGLWQLYWHKDYQPPASRPGLLPQ
jgi:prepilin-type processing-associated H-X9-DG protein